MTQTIDAQNTVNAVVHISADGATWTDISGSTNKVDQPAQEADMGEAATLDGNYMISTSGKLKPVDVSVTVLYTEQSSEGYELLRAQFEKVGRPLYLRWSPKGAYNTRRYTLANGAGAADAGIITSLQYPGADASEANPTKCTLKVRADRIIVSQVAPSASMSPSASLSPSASVSPSASKSAGT